MIRAAPTTTMAPPVCNHHDARRTGVIVYRRRGLVFAEASYEPMPPRRPRADILRVTTSSVLPDAASRARKSHTLLVDLSRAEQTLFDEMDKGTRYEVRRAIDKDDLDYRLDAECSATDIGLFGDYYDRFAASKQRRPVFRTRLHVLAQQGMLILTRSLDRDGEILVWHSYIKCPDRLILLYSASLFREKQDASHRNLVGRANRFTHWNDILAAKEMGLPTYDMGGIDVAGRSPETANIAQFKKGFGGTVVPVYSHTIPMSLVGRVACTVAGLVGREI
jgi:hypothetical protein